MSSLDSEISSWRSFQQALRTDDKDALRNLYSKVYSFKSAIESMPEEYQTEAFFMALLIIQQKEIDRLETRKREILTSN